jgi:hypothetical protein
LVGSSLAMMAAAVIGCGAGPEDGGGAPAPGAPASAAQALALAPTSAPQIRFPPPICGLRLLTPPGAFDFDDDGPDGWQLARLFDGDGTTPLGAAATSQFPTVFVDALNASDPPGQVLPPDGRGSVAAALAADNIPSTSTSGWWRQDLISPDLSAVNAWQGHGTISFAVYDGMSSGGPPIETQLVLDVIKCDGTSALYHAVTSSRFPVYCAAQRGAWANCTFSIDLTGVDTIRHVIVRVYGTTGPLYEGGVFVDQIHGH